MSNFEIKDGELKKYRGTDSDVIIPKGVKSIGFGAFSDNKSLTSVTIPEGVTSIDGSAFFGCENLTNVTIPEGVTSIDSMAFCQCKSLTSVTIPEGVTSIGGSTFSSCESLTSVTIPDSLTIIYGDAFSHCKNLTSVTIPENVTNIYPGAFEFCKSLTSVTIPEGVTSIGKSAFAYCKRLKKATIGGTGCTISEMAFFGCDALTEVIINEGVKSIEKEAFSCCSGIKKITVPDSVVRIGTDASKYVKDDCVLYTSRGSYADRHLVFRKEYILGANQKRSMYAEAAKLQAAGGLENLKAAYQIWKQLEDYQDSLCRSMECSIGIALLAPSCIKQVIAELLTDFQEAEDSRAEICQKLLGKWNDADDAKQAEATAILAKLNEKQAELDQLASKLFAGKKRKSLIAEIETLKSRRRSLITELAESGGYVFPEQNLPLSDWVIAAKMMRSHFNDMQITDETAHRYFENLYYWTEREAQKQIRTPQNGSVDVDCLSAASFNSKYGNCTAENKTKSILRGHLEDLNQKISARIKGEEAIRTLGFVMAQSYSSKPTNDWAVLGGIANGLAGPVAGFAVAAQTMAQNAAIEAENARNRAAAKEQAMNMYRLAMDASGERNDLERERDRVQRLLALPPERIVKASLDSDEFQKAVKCVCNRGSIELRETSIVFTAFVTNTGYSSDENGAALAVDGVLEAKIFCDKGVLIDTVPLVLPMGGIPYMQQAAVVGVSNKYMIGKHDNYRVEIAPKSMWVVEI